MARDYSKTRDFGWALAQLRQGYFVCRTGWNGKGMWLALQVPDAHSKMSLPYIYMKTAAEELVPWLASQTDMLSEDWEYASIPSDVRMPASPGLPGKHIPDEDPAQ